MAKAFSHFTYEQRCELKSMLDNKTPIIKIANTLSFSRASIYREIKRGQVNGIYTPDFSDVPLSRNTIYNAIDNGLIPGVTRDSLHSKETTVFNGGNIILAKWLRDELDIKDGDTLHFEISGDKKIIFLPFNTKGC